MSVPFCDLTLLPFCSQSVSLQHFIQIKLYFPSLNILFTNQRGHLMQSYPNGHCIGCVVGSGDSGAGSSHNLWPPMWVKCNLNPGQFAGLTLNKQELELGVSALSLCVAQQPGLAWPWLGRGVKIHLNSIWIHLVQLLSTFSNVAFYFKFYYVLNGLWAFKKRVKRRKVKNQMKRTESIRRRNSQTGLCGYLI